MNGFFRLCIKPFLVSIGLSALAACGGVQLGTNALDRNLPPAQAQACRKAVSEAIAREGISPDALRNVSFQVVESTSHASSNRLRGFEAWVYPLSGGAWLVTLTSSCRVTDVRQLRAG